MPNECTWDRAKEIFKVLSYDTDLGVVVRRGPAPGQ